MNLLSKNQRLDAELQAELERTHDSFVFGADYLKEWGYQVINRGEIPYVGNDRKVQGPAYRPK